LSFVLCATNSRLFTEISSFAARSPPYHLTTTRSSGYAHEAIGESWRPVAERRVIARCEALSCLTVLSFPQAHAYFLASHSYRQISLPMESYLPLNFAETLPSSHKVGGCGCGCVRRRSKGSRHAVDVLQDDSDRQRAILVSNVARTACCADRSSNQASSKKRGRLCTADFQGPVDSIHWLKSRTGTLRSIGERDY
jgi:hypothetical protein